LFNNNSGYKPEKPESQKVTIDENMVKDAVVETKDDYNKSKSNTPNSAKESDTYVHL